MCLFPQEKNQENSYGTQGREKARGEEARLRETHGGEEIRSCRESPGGEEAQGREEASQGRWSRRRRQEEEAREEERGNLQDLYLQGPEASSPRHRDLQQGHGDHEQLYQRYLREARSGGFAFGSLQQEANHYFSGDSDRRSFGLAW